MGARKIQNVFRSNFGLDVSLVFEEIGRKGKTNIRTLAIVPQGVFDFKVPNMAAKRHRS